MICKNTLLTAAVGAFATAGLVLSNHPGGIQAAYRDVRDLPALEEQMKQYEAEFRTADQRMAVANARSSVRFALVAELIAGRTTLTEVAARFGELNADFPAAGQTLQMRFPDRPEEEQLALSVIDYTRPHELPPDLECEVIARLDAEYLAAFGRHSPFCR